MIQISEHNENLIKDIIQFREKTYVHSGRDPKGLQVWSYDDYDKSAIHILMYNENKEIIAGVRLLDGTKKWTLDNYIQYPYDPQKSFEFGRLGVLQNYFQGKRVLFELMNTACEYSKGQKRDHFYGFVIEEFQQALQKQQVPFTVLSPPLYPYNHKTHLIRFEIDAVISTYQKKLLKNLTLSYMDANKKQVKK